MHPVFYSNSVLAMVQLENMYNVEGVLDFDWHHASHSSWYL